MSIANEHTDTFYLADFEFKDPVNATYIMAFWDQTPCNSAKIDIYIRNKSWYYLLYLLT